MRTPWIDRSTFNLRSPSLAMDAHDRTRKLPVELLSMILDDLCLDDVLRSSHVSKFWRSVAKRHPTYWRDIILASLSTTALDLFHDRLDASCDQSISLFIYLPTVDSPSRLRSIVLPAIVRNMHRIHHLVLNSPLSHDTDMFNALCTPAPRLEKLDIYVIDDAAASTAFPIDLFANNAPKFKRLHLYNVHLLPNSLPPVLSGIHTLKYFVANELSFPAAMLPHCRSLRKLSIFGSGCRLIAPQTSEYVEIASRLEVLDVGVFYACLDFVHAFPCRSIAHVSIPVQQQAAARILLAQLHGDLQLRIEYDDGMITVGYAALASGMKRTFVYARAVLADVTITEPYAARELLLRVQEVYVSSVCVPLLSSLRALPSCTRIAVSGADEHPLELPPAALDLPKLHTIEIACGAGYSDTNVRAFVDAAVAQVKSPVRVCLDDGARRRYLTIGPRCDCVPVS
ncbi:hypothetical protein AURDEDRAFT_188759 [Auricularia subglabra TFB-10046 SS5]|uniref:F-box domain-containing protein n=1 Tax=Auricularia subglabra (strain TFB-10046 / SS5) TaxID=717982 RepID=J0CX96_AURST|nr:hypothetical protein AURDEDRAFT_188759 [Auricularia subglabra TFB-10046 SS5]